jgi:Zn finger protein HypA/HybF involved in hydrogenase expression
LTAFGLPGRVGSGELPQAEVVVVDEVRKREDEWFVAHEKELLAGARLERAKRERERAALTEEAERVRLRTEHFMRCPKCGHEMKEETLEGVSVDRCSHCEGIYFDAGELDQVLLKHDAGRRGFFRKLVKI